MRWWRRWDTSPANKSLSGTKQIKHLCAVGGTPQCPWYEVNCRLRCLNCVTAVLPKWLASTLRSVFEEARPQLCDCSHSWNASVNFAKCFSMLILFNCVTVVLPQMHVLTLRRVFDVDTPQLCDCCHAQNASVKTTKHSWSRHASTAWLLSCPKCKC